MAVYLKQQRENIGKMSEKALFFAITIFQLFIGNIKVNAQEPIARSWSLGSSYSRSFIIKHDPKLGHLITGSPEGFNLFFEQVPDGTKTWHQAYRYAPIGLALGCFDLKNSDLGDLAYVSAYLNWPMVHSGLFALNLKVCTGLGFATNPYH